jgi:hypothetical protein
VTASRLMHREATTIAAWWSERRVGVGGSDPRRDLDHPGGLAKAFSSDAFTPPMRAEPASACNGRIALSGPGLLSRHPHAFSEPWMPATTWA